MRVSDRVGPLDRMLMRPKRGYIHYLQPGPPPADADLDIRIGPFDLAPPADAVRLDRRFLVGRDWFGCDDTYKVLAWRVEISGWEAEKTRVRIAPDGLGTAAIGSRIIDCLVRFKLCARGAPAVHSCGVVHRGRACLLSGRSGVGKSTLAMRMLDRGSTLLGDNWIIVHEGQALSLHLPINIYTYNVAPRLRDRLPAAHRFDMRWKKLVHDLSLGYLKKSTPVVLRELLPDLAAERAPLARIFLMSQGPRFRLEPMSRPDALARLVANDMMDREAFYRYMRAYAVHNPAGPVANHWARLHDALDRAIAPETELFDLVVERRITPEVVDRVAAEMER
jgi:hypothetical protein